MLLALERGQDRGQQFRVDQSAPVVALGAQPNEHLAGRGMFANTALQHFLQLGVLSGVPKHMRDLSDHSAVRRLHQLQRARAPALSKGGRQRLQDAFLFRRRQLWQDQDQPPLLIDN